MRKVIVIGGGLAGVTTAYELMSRGFPTTLYEARQGVALETSYANGCMLTPSMADPWNAPGVHHHLIASLFRRRSALTIRPTALPSLLAWGWRFLRHSTTARHEAATEASFRLAHYSLARTTELREALALQYDAARSGALKVFCDQAAMQGSLALSRRLAPLGLQFQMLDADGAVHAEPALADIRERICGALWFPDDETGDAKRFCEGLEAAFVRIGGLVERNATVTRIDFRKGVVTGVRAGQRTEDTDLVIVAAGNSTAPLLRRAGISLPIRPAKGYTVSVDISNVEGAPRIPVVDDALHAAIVPLGSQLRIAGTAEFAGHDLRIDSQRVDCLWRLFESLTPRVAAQVTRESARPWTGLRPMSVDGLPFIGPLRARGLYVNSGHGHLGWTFAAGSARLLADVIEGKDTAIDATPFRADRLSSRRGGKLG